MRTTASISVRATLRHDRNTQRARKDSQAPQMTDTPPQSRPFDKYAALGAYHWVECDKNAPDHLYNPPLEARYRVLSRRIHTQGKVLDVGCGDGYLMSRISPHCDRAIGIDPEPTAVRLAEDMLLPYTNCRVVQGSCYRLAFADATFDVAVMADVVEHLEMPEVALKEIKRVLKPAGSLLVTTPKARPNQMWDERHVREYLPEQLVDLLSSAFSDTTLSYFWPIWWCRFYESRMGWRSTKLLSKYLYNPFNREGGDPAHFGQCLAVCKRGARP
jgi:2-polyprenyl-3-methyl-5-hydroxy-6-metoxy-1,4-benzoquinol methylase